MAKKTKFNCFDNGHGVKAFIYLYYETEIFSHYVETICEFCQNISIENRVHNLLFKTISEIDYLTLS